MASIESRLAKLENAAPAENAAFEQFIRQLPPLDASGRLGWHSVYPNFDEIFGPWLTNLGNESRRHSQLSDPIERGLAKLLEDFNDSPDPLAYERYRGRVPDRVLAAIYNGMRNVGFPSDTCLKIRQLAGVVDQAGNLAPGHVMSENGFIVDAETVGHG